MLKVIIIHPLEAVFEYFFLQRFTHIGIIHFSYD